jgi:hypothetical protein
VVRRNRLARVRGCVVVKYQVAQRYTASRDGLIVGPYAAGDVVDLDDEAAAWVNRDAPGTLAPIAVEVPAADNPPRAAATRTSGPRAKA